MIATFLGIDLSLSATGIAVVGCGVAYCKTVCSSPREFANIYDRIDHMRDSVLDFICKYNPEMICIEKPIISTQKIRGNDALIALGFEVRRSMVKNENPFYDVHIQHVKMYATGKGTAKKEEVMAAVSAIGINPGDDNQADAVMLALMARSIYEINHGGEYPQDVKKRQAIEGTLKAARK